MIFFLLPWFSAILGPFFSEEHRPNAPHPAANIERHGLAADPTPAPKKQGMPLVHLWNHVAILFEQIILIYKSTHVQVMWFAMTIPLLI